MSVDGIRISHLASKSNELSQYMNQSLDAQWKSLRGLEIVSIALASISYTDDSQKLINMRNKGAMLSDPTIRDSFVQGSIASGIEAAGNNPNGAGNAFFGLGMGMQASGEYLSQAAKNNQQAQAPNQNMQVWYCPDCNQENTGKFCSNCGKAKPQTTNTLQMKCSHCQHIIQLDQGIPKFCPECGQPFLGQAL